MSLNELCTLNQKRIVVSSKMLNRNNYYAIWCIVVAVLYFAAGLAFFIPYENWTFTTTTYFLLQTVTTVGYGDVTPQNNVSRVVTCVFAAVGVAAVAGIFSEMMYQIFCVHRDRALVESLSNVERQDGRDGSADGSGIRHALGIRERQRMRENTLGEESKNPVTALLDRQINMKFWASAWMVLEIFVLIVFGAMLIYTVEPNWDLVVCVYWAVSTCFTIGYGWPAPVTYSGRWVAVIYMTISCFIFMNIVANLASLPAMYHRRTTDLLVISQFDPSVDSDLKAALEGTAGPKEEMEAFASRLRQSHMQFQGRAFSSSKNGSENGRSVRSSYGTASNQDQATGATEQSGVEREDDEENWTSSSPLLSRIGASSTMKTGETHEGASARNKDLDITEIFGNTMAAASEDNVAFLRDICSTKEGVTKDEFSLWLLFLLGRIDATDIQVVRETYENFQARRSGEHKEDSSLSREQSVPPRPLRFEDVTEVPMN